MHRCAREHTLAQRTKRLARRADAAVDCAAITAVASHGVAKIRELADDGYEPTTRQQHAREVGTVEGGRVEGGRVEGVDASKVDAVSFQRNVLEKLGFQELQDALPIIQRIAQANPGLELDRMLQQDVSPLRFRQVATASGSE